MSVQLGTTRQARYALDSPTARCETAHAPTDNVVPTRPACVSMTETLLLSRFAMQRSCWDSFATMRIGQAPTGIRRVTDNVASSTCR